MRRWEWSFGINPRDLNSRALKPEDWTRYTPYFRKQARLTLLCSFVLVDPSDWMISYHNGESQSFTKAVGSNARLFRKSFIGSPRLTHHLFGTPQPSQTAKHTNKNYTPQANKAKQSNNWKKNPKTQKVTSEGVKEIKNNKRKYIA